MRRSPSLLATALPALPVFARTTSSRRLQRCYKVYFESPSILTHHPLFVGHGEAVSPGAVEPVEARECQRYEE